jgi:DNA-binding beta-propeller fold protein YncE
MRICTAAIALCAATPLAAQISHTHLGTVQAANNAGEIVAFDPGSNRFFVTNGANQSLAVYAMSATGSLAFVQSIPLGGAPNSVAVKNGLVAAAVEGATGQALGMVKFFDAATGAANGPAVTVGAMPDMLAFTPDGSKVLTANEGEADLATGLINPEGSVSIVDVATRIAVTASFAPWNSQKAALQAAGVRIVNNNGITLAQDLEPEYLTIDAAGTTAYVTLQEANALAEIDIATATVTQIRPLGFKDHGLPGNEFDASNSDGINGNFVNHPVYGIYMPDAIASFTIGGVTYLATANEGDSRADFFGFRDETRGSSLAANFVLDAEDPTPETGIYTLATRRSAGSTSPPAPTTSPAATPTTTATSTACTPSAAARSRSGRPPGRRCSTPARRSSARCWRADFGTTRAPTTRAPNPRRSSPASSTACHCSSSASNAPTP